MKIKAGKYERIPSRYSEELSRVINWMLLQNSQDRPTVEDLMNMPQVSMRIREKKMQDTWTLIRKREEELRAKEDELKERERVLKEKERDIVEKESLINELIKSQEKCGENGKKS